MQAGDSSPGEKDEFQELRSDQDQEGNFSKRVSDILDPEQTRRTINSLYDDEEVKAQMAQHEKQPRLACMVFAEHIRKKLAILLRNYAAERKKTADWVCSLDVTVGTCYAQSHFFNKKLSMFNICAFSNSKYTVTVTVQSGLDSN